MAANNAELNIFRNFLIDMLNNMNNSQNREQAIRDNEESLHNVLENIRNSSPEMRELLTAPEVIAAREAHSNRN